MGSFKSLEDKLDLSSYKYSTKNLLLRFVESINP